MKNLLKILVALVLVSYIAYAFTKEKDWTNTNPCQRLAISVLDSSRASFVSTRDILLLLQEKHLNPVGEPMNKIDLSRIEATLKGHKFVLDAQCYKTADNTVHVDVSQRLPVMRVMTARGGNYFIDGKGNKIANVNYPADVIVATGAISAKYCQKVLAPIGRILQRDEFWNYQIEQLNVLRDGTIEMIPRVGNHVVYFGSPQDLPLKLRKLKVFYQKVLARVGWNKYSRINMEYNNQIICTKTE